MNTVSGNNHLFRRNGVYYYRRRVPAQLSFQPIGSKVIQFSLGTTSLKQAKQLRTAKDLEWDVRFEACAKKLSSSDAGSVASPSSAKAPPLSEPEMIRLVHEYVERMDERSGKRFASDPPLDQQEKLDMWKEANIDAQIVRDCDHPQADQWIGVRKSAREFGVWPKTRRYWRKRWREADDIQGDLRSIPARPQRRIIRFVGVHRLLLNEPQALLLRPRIRQCLDEPVTVRSAGALRMCDNPHREGLRAIPEGTSCSAPSKRRGYNRLITNSLFGIYIQFKNRALQPRRECGIVCTLCGGSTCHGIKPRRIPCTDRRGEPTN